MKYLLPILALAAFFWAQVPAAAAQAAEQEPSNPPSSADVPAIPVDKENARKAKELLDQAVQALGGQAYLNVRDMQQSGRTYSFHHGRPTSNGIQFQPGGSSRLSLSNTLVADNGGIGINILATGSGTGTP